MIRHITGNDAYSFNSLEIDARFAMLFLRDFAGAVCAAAIGA
jgi:hypothetical protein